MQNYETALFNKKKYELLRWTSHTNNSYPLLAWLLATSESKISGDFLS